jgi:hypothetical protein
VRPASNPNSSLYCRRKISNNFASNAVSQHRRSAQALLILASPSAQGQGTVANGLISKANRSVGTSPPVTRRVIGEGHQYDNRQQCDNNYKF